MHKDQKLGLIIKIAQKTLVFSLFFAMIGLFVFSLIFMTPFYDLYVLDNPFLFTNMNKYGLADEYKQAYEGIKDAFSYNPVSGKQAGMNLAYFTSFTRDSETGLQAYNHWLFRMGLIGIVVSLVPFIFISHKRKRFYVTNYVALAGVAIFELYAGISLLASNSAYRAYVAGVDFKILNAYSSYLNNLDTINEYYSFAKCDYVFVLGNIVGLIIIAIGILSLAFLALKFIYQSRQPKLDLSEVKIDE